MWQTYKQLSVLQQKALGFVVQVALWSPSLTDTPLNIIHFYGIYFWVSEEQG